MQIMLVNINEVDGKIECFIIPKDRNSWVQIN